MADILDIYNEIQATKDPRKKYRSSLKLVEYHCEKGEVTQAQHTISTLTESYATDSGITMEQLQRNTSRILCKGYKNAVPKTIKDIEASLDEDGAKNFSYLEAKIREAYNYATESKAYSASELNQLSKKLEELRNKLLEVKAKTPEEDILDWQVINLNAIEDGTTGHY